MHCAVMHYKITQLINLATFVASIIDATLGPDTEAELMQMMVQSLLAELDEAGTSKVNPPDSFSRFLVSMHGSFSDRVSTFAFFIGDSWAGAFSSESSTDLFLPCSMLMRLSVEIVE